MAYFYVKAGGTATADLGRSATKRTGSFATMTAANYYDSLDQVFDGTTITTPPVASDIVLCSDLHDKQYSGGDIYLNIVPRVTCVSVSDTAANSYSAGAIERVTSVHDMLIGSSSSGAIHCKGISFKAGDDIRLIRASGSYLILEDCTLALTGTSTSDEIQATYDGTVVHLINVIMSFSHYGQSYDLSNTSLIWEGGSMAGNTIQYLFESAGRNSKGAIIRGVDLTNVTASITKAFASAAATFSTIALTGCLLRSGTTLSSVTPVTPTMYATASSLGIGTDTDNYHSYYETYYAGSYEDVEGVYRLAGATYNGTNHFSSRVITNANTGPAAMLETRLSSFVIDTDDYTSTVTFTVHFAVGSAVTMNSDDFGVQINHVDGADQSLTSVVNTTTIIDSNAPTVETGLWTGLAGTNSQMSISKSITIGSSSGNIASGPVVVTIRATRPSTVFFVCPQVEIS